MAITNDVVDANNTTRHKYWRHWCEYVKPLYIKPFLQNTECKEVILATTGVTAWVWRKYHGYVKCVTVQTPQVALSAISKTTEMEAGVSPIYRGYNK